MDNKLENFIERITKNNKIDLNNDNDIDVLLSLLSNNKNRDIIEFINTIMDDNNIDTSDILHTTYYNTDDILDELCEYDIVDYCKRYCLINDDNEEIPDDPDIACLNALSDYCHLKHTICDYDTVIEEIKDLLKMHSYDKKLL